MSKTINIAIDGPAGAGKSTLARIIAEKLGYIYVDTGALYRAVGLHVFRRGADPRDEAAVAALLPALSLRLAYVNGAQRVFLLDEDVSEAIRAPRMSEYASLVSALPAVRAWLLQLQRDMAAAHNVVMDGRDIGTVVLPDAKIKIFLHADPADRARRRWEEQKAKGVDEPYEDVLRELLRRDERDSNRAVAPLRPAPDAVALDTTGNSLEMSVAQLTALVEGRLRDVV